MRRNTLSTVAIFGLFLLPVKLTLAAEYGVIDLSRGTGGNWWALPTTGQDINAGGQATGITDWAWQSDARAFVTQNGTMHDLGSLGGSSTGYGINANGQVTGVSDTVDGNSHAFVTQNGVMHDLGTLGGNNSAGYGINSSGQVVGESSTANGNTHAFMSQNGVMRDLGTLGGSDSGASDINDSGQITGYSTTADGKTHAFVAENGVMSDIDSFGGNYSVGTGINASGQVAGVFLMADNIHIHAFSSQNGAMHDLGTLGGSTSYANDINAGGQIVGFSATSDTSQAAFVTRNGVMSNLNGLIDPIQDYDTVRGSIYWYLVNAVAINDAGQILANGRNSINGTNHAFLLTPIVTAVPVPGAVWLFGTGLLGLLGLKRRGLAG